MKRAGRLALDGPTLVSLDLTRFADTAAVAGAGRAAVASVAAELEAEAPSLAKALRLAPPGGTPLLAAAFAFFLRRQVVTNPTLAAELTHDTLQLLTDGQRAGFATPEASLDAKWGQVAEVCADGFHTIGVELKDVHDKLDRLLETRQVSTAAEATLKVSVTNEAEQKSLRDYREKLRALPPECV